MKAKLLGVIVLLASLVVVLTSIVSAQGPNPTPASPRRGPPPLQLTAPQPFSGIQSKDTGRFGTSASPQSSGGRSPVKPQVALGQPGLSFRYLQTYGVTDQAYFSDAQHLNVPVGLFIDGSNNLFVTEERGYRVLKYNSGGTNTLALGTAGLQYTDKYVFTSPEDVALDAGGNIWVADGNRVVEYSPTGTFLQSLPATNSWQSGSDNTHFSFVPGIAFDNAAGRMFVSDNNNQRVQVYTFSGSTPVYSATIGVTGVSGSDNSHLNHPERLAVDSSGRLYIVEYDNNRVQRCSLSGTWTCSTFMSVLNRPNGIAIDSGDNVFVADSGNGRIRKCDSTGLTCSDVVTGLPDWAADVAVDSSGNIYVSQYWRYEVREYTSGGVFVSSFVGTTSVPYVTDASHISMPWGIAVATDGSIYVAERNSFRLLKFNASGTQQWTIGQLGVYGSDNTHFGIYWAGIEGNLALDASGRVYVPDTGNHRIQVFNPNGSYSFTFGSFGTANNQFNCPAGVAINPSNGDIAVVDKCNQRVQVYDSSWTYKATLGTLGAKGSDNAHFSNPWGDAIDASGNIYVGDSDNHRVQKCTPSGLAYSCATFAGTTGIQGSNFDHLAHPLGIAVDSANQVYVADEWNNRIQVYDSSSAFLTTFGGWGALTGQLRNPKSVALDAAGTVYVTDSTNGRIQKYARGVPSWIQSNINAFGDATNGNIHSLGVFGGQLYAGTYNSAGNGAQIWRTSSSSNWSLATTPGFGITTTVGINNLVVFNNQLYAGVRNDSQGAKIYRSSDGSTWDPVVTSGFTDPKNAAVYRFGVFNGQIYAGTGIFTTTHGAEIWRSPSGDSGTWTQVVANGFGSVGNYIIRSSEVYSGSLYFGTDNWNSSTMTTTGGAVFRSSTGNSGDWTQVNAGGFGDINSEVVSSLAAFNGYLYASTAYAYHGDEVWRCQICDGSDWTRVVSNGFGNPSSFFISNMQVVDDKLYVAMGNTVTGMEVWASSTGNAGSWTRVGAAGLGNSNNAMPYHNNLTVFNNALYLGTNNSANGPQVWELLAKQFFLPLITR